ncbi:hypothetical protein VM1G_03611 [Cytospora mali]|uniref:ferroxidase n=1 Tax=Cytospora mali TaxID=578113 RepID=A0A194VU73_CYTMA|nr:hypothetical protein VM1G_03611 [Valsa mali]
MTRQSLSRATGILARGLRTSTATIGATRSAPRPALPILSQAVLLPVAARSRFLSTTSSRHKGILPDSDDPTPPNVQDHDIKPVPAELTDGEYHELADEYLEVVLAQLESIADKNESVEVEYSAGVLTVVFPQIGTYVINKQPPNKQIWLSSPISGPKRYDYVLYGEGQAQKEGTAMGDWVYLRDGSTLTELFLGELGVDLSLPLPQ